MKFKLTILFVFIIVFPVISAQEIGSDATRTIDISEVITEDIQHKDPRRAYAQYVAGINELMNNMFETTVYSETEFTCEGKSTGIAVLRDPDNPKKITWKEKSLYSVTRINNTIDIRIECDGTYFSRRIHFSFRVAKKTVVVEDEKTKKKIKKKVEVPQNYRLYYYKNDFGPGQVLSMKSYIKKVKGKAKEIYHARYSYSVWGKKKKLVNVNKYTKDKWQSLKKIAHKAMKIKGNIKEQKIIIDGTILLELWNDDLTWVSKHFAPKEDDNEKVEKD